MAIYSLNISSASSAVAALSYITSMRVRDDARGETYSGFGRRERVAHVATLLPEGAPSGYADPERLFNAAQAAERGTGVAAKKIMVALPRELDEGQRVLAVERFIRENLTAGGYAATYAIHLDREGRNPHAHILVANRRIDPRTGEWARLKQKTTFTLDGNGQRIPVIDPKTGMQKVDKRNRKQWKRVTVSENPLGTKAMLLSMRESWADVCNGLLPEGVRIDHRSLEEQGIDRVPTIHEGYAAREMEKHGQPSDRMAINREIEASNRDLAEGDAAVDALHAHQSELRRLLHDMADRAAQAFDRMLESIGHGTDPSDAMEEMRDRDGINLMIPRNAKDSDRPVWHAWLYDRHEWAAIPSHILREGLRTVGHIRAAIGTALHRWRDAQAARRERIARPTPDPAPRLADVPRQTREDAGQPAHQTRRPVRKPEQQPERQEQQQERPVSLAAAAKEAKEASKQLKREREPEPEPTLEWNPWDSSDPMNLAMGGSQGYGLGL